MDEPSIKDMFLTVSDGVISVKMIKKNEQPAGYCFVNFSTEAEAERVLKLVNGTDIPGWKPRKKFRLNRSTQKLYDFGPNFSIYVGGLDPAVTDDKLHDYFLKNYPSVKGAKIMYEGGISKGYGFVRFSDESEQQHALKECHGKAVGLGKSVLRVKPAIPKGSTAPATQTTPSANSYTTSQHQQYYNQYYNYYYNQDQSYNNQQYQQSYYQQDYSQQQYQQQQYDYNSNVAEVQQQNTNIISIKTEDIDEYDLDPIPEDPMEPINVNAENKKYFRDYSGLLDDVSGSHWQPLDSLESKIPEFSETMS